MHYLPLIGVLIIVIGFIMKIDTIAVVIIAGIITGLVSGLSLTEVLVLLGQGFTENRLVTLFVLTLTMIGLSERFGLKEQAVYLINKIKGLTVGRFLSLYLLIREVAGMFSLRLGGHPQFVRPLIEPMAQASAVANYEDTDEETQERIKAQASVMENMGNFYAQNTFVGSSGTLLIAGTLKSLGYDAPAAKIAVASLVIAGISLLMGIVYNIWFDRQLSKKYKKAGGDQ
ncbi:Uncharacterized membrane protein [Atopostipes suicloacalis DSM 15692]|uniref:Uncharacterized membrane protein n=1 Tax=Atopostipes suicloacalis DSM 15692 TaxID=1121025 RepID=A0A1M4Y813_9LACT|nr:DUF969 domain-containing protein [Atopostipes suicloacalis]SHF01809.1 Uncharacterized membrane protein [Atopostipes suicloacalis DSM 15692]